MKIYFAGPLFTPYVRQFISEHAQLLREHGIDPFVPHERFNSMIKPEVIRSLLEQGLVQLSESGSQPTSEAVMELVRAGKLNREQVGLPPSTPGVIFDTDMEGLASANAVLALLDGTQVDDGTACEIGIFYGLAQTDPSKKGVVGFMADSRGTRKKEHGFGLNLFVLGVLQECGTIYDNFEDVVHHLETWQAELETNG